MEDKTQTEVTKTTEQPETSPIDTGNWANTKKTSPIDTGKQADTKKTSPIDTGKQANTKKTSPIDTKNNTSKETSFHDHGDGKVDF